MKKKVTLKYVAKRQSPHIRVMHLVNDLSYAGAQRIILDMVREIDKSRFEPVVAMWGGRKELLKEFVSLNIEVIDLRGGRKLDIRAAQRLYKYLKKKPVDILHTHLFHMHIIGRLAGKLAKVPWIVSTHHNFRQSNHPIMKFGERVTRSLTDVTTAVTYAAEESYFPTGEYFTVQGLLSGRKHFTIYNSVNMDEVDRTRKHDNKQSKRYKLGLGQEIILVCVSRLHPVKGHLYLIDAMNMVREIYPELLLLIVGDGELRKELSNKVRAYGLEKYIRFLGYRSDVYDILFASDIFVLPSVYEGFGLAIAEAMAFDLPVVATDLPSIREVVVHEKTGLLVPPRNPAALAGAILRLMESPSLAKSYGHNGRQRVEDLFSLKMITRQYEDLYKELGDVV